MRIETPNLIECGTCGNKVLPHRICPKCGFYRGNQIIEPEEMA
jgi:large subunit ribosomal protein L32